MSDSATFFGDVRVQGVVSGNNGIGGNAASIQGVGTGGNDGVFSFKYDKAGQGDTERAIQIWNASSGVFKTFIVDHPLDENKYIVHATLEGPEGGVYYRGTSQLYNGKATISLPHYFEAFTRKEGRTILLTNIDGFDRIAIQSVDGEKIVDGKFVVVSDNPESSQKFDWEVKAVRADGPKLQAEPDKQDLQVGGFGPYTFALKQKQNTSEQNADE